MKILAVPAANDASAHLRLVWPAEAVIKLLGSLESELRTSNFELALESELRTSNFELAPTVELAPLGWSLTVGLDVDDHVVQVEHPGYDVLVFQRLQSRMIAEAIPLLQDQGVGIVVDVDDDFSCIDPNNVAWKTMAPLARWTVAACARADMVTVTTPALASRYGGHGRVRVLPNRIPRRVLALERGLRRIDSVRVGWAGTVATHPTDLQVTRGAIGRFINARHLNFGVVGPGDQVQRNLGLSAPPIATGLVDYRYWYEHLIELDVGIVPLADTRFNQAKSGLKALEFAACGVVPIMTPTADNLRVHASGIGMLAKRPTDWLRCLTQLVDDGVTRQAMSAAGRAAVGAHHVLENGAGDWLRAWVAAARI